MKVEEYPTTKFKPLSYDEKVLMNRIKQRVYLTSDEEIMTWIRKLKSKCHK